MTTDPKALIARARKQYEEGLSWLTVIPPTQASKEILDLTETLGNLADALEATTQRLEAAEAFVEHAKYAYSYDPHGDMLLEKWRSLKAGS